MSNNLRTFYIGQDYQLVNFLYHTLRTNSDLVLNIFFIDIFIEKWIITVYFIKKNMSNKNESYEEYNSSNYKN